MPEAKNVREASPDIVEGNYESEFKEENNNKTTVFSMVNEKLDVLLTKYDKIETSINTLKTTVDMLVNKQTIIDVALCKLQKENDDKSTSIINTENCCTKILELIEERALSFESAIQHASDQIKGQIVGSIPIGADTIQSTVTDNSILALLEEVKTTTALASAPVIPAEIIASENEILYTHYDFELSSSFTSKLPGDISLDSDDSFSSTPISTNRSAKRQKTANQISTNVSRNLFPSVTTSNGAQIILTDPNTQTTFQVMKDRYDRHQVATNQELLDKEAGFRHLLAYLFSTLFTEEELKISSVDGSVRGTKAFDPIRVAAIDKHLFDVYGARYVKFRSSNQYKEILNKKCSRIRTKFNKSTDNN